MNKHLLTIDGLKKLEEELKYLINDKRKEVIERIREAAAHGDLSENADYALAREEQSFVESRILEIEDMIKHAEIIKTDSPSTGHVNIGTTVVLKGPSGEKTYTIVGSTEANPSEGKISNESNVGKAVLGKKVGEKAKVLTPSGEVMYQIVQIK